MVLSACYKNDLCKIIIYYDFYKIFILFFSIISIYFIYRWLYMKYYVGAAI